MARRRYQQGSLSKEGNRWIARWREDVALPSGEVKRIRKKEILGTLEELPTKKLAQRALAKRLEPVNHEDYRPTSTVTFGLFADKWMKDIMIHHKPSSQSSEKSVVNVQLVPFFGENQLRNINLEMIQRFVNTSEKKPKTVKNAISVLMVMWDMARAWGYVQHNPFPRGTNGRLLLKMPEVVKGKGYNFTVEETLAIIDKAQGRWKVFFRILAETGMRPGELAGLRTVDVGPRAIRIAQSVWQQVVQTPKTENAVRTFAISASLAEAIREMIDGRNPVRGILADKTGGRVLDGPARSGGNHKRPGGEVCGLRGHREGDHGAVAESESGRGILSRHVASGMNDLLFTTDPGRKPGSGGRPLCMDDFRHRVLNPILDELGIRAKIQALGVRGGNYAFRHMNATVMDGLKTPLKTRQKRLGHADIATTLTHYSHAVDADDLATADQIGALLSPKGTEAVQ